MSTAPQPSNSTMQSTRGKLIRTGLKLSYAIVSGIVSVWIASFMPGEGPPIAAFIPPNAAAVLHLRDGSMLLKELPESAALKELLGDPDIETLFSIQAQRTKLLEKYAKAPAPARWLFPFELDSLKPVIGRDVALISFPPVVETSGDRRRIATPVLAVTHLSGSRGLLIRLAARFAPASRQTQLYDLGGGLVAVGVDGATPPPPHEISGKPSTGQSAPIAKISINPAALKVEQKELSVRISPQFDQMKADGLPEAVLNALLHPPPLSEIFGMQKSPANIEIDVFPAPNGKFTAHGALSGDLPAPQYSPDNAGERVFDEVYLPINAEAAFLRYLEGEMRLQGSAPMLHKGQRKWSRRLFNLEEHEIDLHRELWPAFGNNFYMSVEQAPPDIIADYGIIRLTLPFDGKNARARFAAGELAREKWDGLFDSPPPKSEKPPYVRRLKGRDFERYVLMTGQTNAPSWTISEKLLSFTSDAGPFAVRDTNVGVPQSPWRDAPSASYFVKLNGPRSANTAEAIADAYFSAKEDALGAREFLEQYPDAELRIKVIKKLTRLLGTFALEIKPDALNHSADIDISWQPGSLATPKEEKSDESVPPPPPPAN